MTQKHMITMADVKIGEWQDETGARYRAAYVGQCVLTGPEHATLSDLDLLAEAEQEARRAGLLETQEGDNPMVIVLRGAGRERIMPWAQAAHELGVTATPVPTFPVRVRGTLIEVASVDDIDAIRGE